MPAFTYRKHPHLYEINTWVWLEQLSRQAGRRITLGGVPSAEWDRLEALGFDFVWLMCVWERSPAGRHISRTNPELFPGYDAALPAWRMEDVVGSGYAVKAYRPDPRIGTWEELDAVRAKLRARGMGLILDFVTNHTGPDHDWVTTHPEYYVQGTQNDFRQNPSAFILSEGADGKIRFVARGRDPFFAPWPDTAQLNYFHTGARVAIVEELRNMAQHCDGLRCDMAMLVLNDVFESTWRLLLPHDAMPRHEFWPQAVAALPDFVWLAEVYWDLEWRMQQLGFQFAYDKRLMDRLHGSTPADIRGHLCAESNYQNGLARFLENHDEPRSAAAFGVERLPAMAALIATLPGMRFYHDGQFEGLRIRPPVQLARVAEETPDQNLRAMYEALLSVSDDPVFHDGAWRLLDVQPAGDSTSQLLIAYEWSSPGGRRVVVVNLGAEAAQGMLHLEGIAAGRAYDFHDQLNGEHYERNGDDLLRDGLYVRLEAYRAHIFAVT